MSHFRRGVYIRRSGYTMKELVEICELIKIWKPEYVEYTLETITILFVNAGKGERFYHRLPEGRHD